MNTFTHNGQLWLVTQCTATKLVAVPAGNLRAERERLGMTTRQLADALGVSQSLVVKMEAGTHTKQLGDCLAKAKTLKPVR